MRSAKDPIEQKKTMESDPFFELNEEPFIEEDVKKEVKTTAKRPRATKAPRKKAVRTKSTKSKEKENKEESSNISDTVNNTVSDKIEEDYQSRHQGDSIWNTRDEIYESFRKDHSSLPEPITLEQQLEETDIPRRRGRPATRHTVKTPAKANKKTEPVSDREYSDSSIDVISSEDIPSDTVASDTRTSDSVTSSEYRNQDYTQESAPVQNSEESPRQGYSRNNSRNYREGGSRYNNNYNPRYNNSRYNNPRYNNNNNNDGSNGDSNDNSSNDNNNGGNNNGNYNNYNGNYNRRQDWNRQQQPNNRGQMNRDNTWRYRGNNNRDSYPEPVSGARGRHGEPISLAEELALRRQPSIKDKTSATEKNIEPVIPADKEQETYISDLQNMTMPELVLEARKENMEPIADEQRGDLAFRILKERIRNNGLMFGEGTLEILPDEFGFLRSPDFHYLSCPDDIYISPSQIRRFGLRNGLTISGQIRPPKEKERYFALLRIEAINQEDPNMLATRPNFDELTAMHPDKRIIMETPDGDINTRVLDLIVPVGFGQRGLIVSPPRAGKTILMQKMARAVLTNYPDSYVFMLLIDERPEEVTDMEREVKGPHCEVVSSTFDEPPARHIQVSEMILEKAKRMVEYGKNVVIFLDSITRLARAWNMECPDSGKTLTGGVDSNALQRPKKFFGSARKVEEGGSLTIIATALVGTGSRMDDVIFEEFKGTGNLEIRLDRSLVDRRIWPAIDITQSGTRREEMILDPDEHLRMSALRRILCEMNPVDGMEYLTEKLSRTKKNVEFLIGLKAD